VVPPAQAARSLLKLGGCCVSVKPLDGINVRVIGFVFFFAPFGHSPLCSTAEICLARETIKMAAFTSPFHSPIRSSPVNVKTRHCCSPTRHCSSPSRWLLHRSSSLWPLSCCWHRFSDPVPAADPFLFLPRKCAGQQLEKTSPT
jgi:hypothetical protein